MVQRVLPLLLILVVLVALVPAGTVSADDFYVTITLDTPTNLSSWGVRISGNISVTGSLGVNWEADTFWETWTVDYPNPHTVCNDKGTGIWPSHENGTVLLPDTRWIFFGENAPSSPYWIRCVSIITPDSGPKRTYYSSEVIVTPSPSLLDIGPLDIDFQMDNLGDPEISYTVNLYFAEGFTPEYSYERCLEWGFVYSSSPFDSPMWKDGVYQFMLPYGSSQWEWGDFVNRKYTPAYLDNELQGNISCFPEAGTYYCRAYVLLQRQTPSWDGYWYKYFYSDQVEVSVTEGCPSGPGPEPEEVLLSPANLTIVDKGQTFVQLSWTKGIGSQNTLIRYKESPFVLGSEWEGHFGYFGSGTSCMIEGLEAGKYYYFSAWGHRYPTSPEGGGGGGGGMG